MKYQSLLFVLLLSFPLYSQESMLCMGAHWTEDEANLQMKKMASSWSDLESWEARKKMIKEHMIKAMQLDRMPNLQGQFKPIIHSSRQMDGYRVENIAIESFPGFFITGNLYSPLESDEKHPAILCPHGHLQDKRLKKDVQTRSAAFARMGAIVFAYDMVGFAESTQVDHRIPIALVLQTFNSRRVLEYLLSRDDVDPERIGMTGGSGGATQTFVLTALDDRIRISAPVVQVSAHFFGGCVCESGMPIHKSANHQTNNVEFAAMAAPRPQLLVSCGGDWTRNTPRVEYPYTQQVYTLYDAEHRVENVHLPHEKHDYGPSKRAVVYPFFAHHLDLNLSALPYENGFREDFVTVLKPELLKVFNSEHPRPEHALLGDQAVMDYLDIYNKQP